MATFTDRLFTLDAFELAKQAGSIKTVSTVMLGALSRFLEFPDEAWLNAIRGKVPKKTIEINERAFAAGKDAVIDAQS